MGKSYDPQSRQMVDGWAFVHRAPKFRSKPTATPAKKPATCYKLIGFPGWTNFEPWFIGSTGNSGISASQIQNLVSEAIQTWENAANADILGDGFIGSAIPSTTADGQNAIAFGNAGGGGTVAVTYVWGSRRTAIFEFDQIYGDNWPWTAGNPNSSAFEFLTVAMHEIGHALGLDHAAISCTLETMYPYVDFGETHQQTLNNGDIAGINALY
jgi:hypothetical protein